MEQIVVNRKNGEKLNLFSYENVSAITSAQQVWELTGDDRLDISVESAVALPFVIGDTIEVFGRLYELNALPPVDKDDDRNFKYNLKFEGIQYRLIKVQFLDYDVTNVATGASFDLMSNIETIGHLIINNLNRFHGINTWEFGEFPTNTSFNNRTYQNQTCLDVLTSICLDYKTNYDIERLPLNRFRINLRVPDRAIEPTFKYGRARGLYRLSRRNISDANIVTRLFAFGGAQNVPPNYRGGSNRVKLPLQYIPNEGEPYIQDNAAIAKYGVIEASINFDDVYPQRTGTVTAIDESTNPNSQLVFFDSSMPFNLSETVNGQTTYLISGVNAKVSFLTGNLSGYEFDVSGYTHSSKKFVINSYTDSNGTVFPSTTSTAFRIEIGDTYKILNISMPQSYVTAAENKLLSLAVDYINTNNRPRVGYDLDIASAFIESFAPSINEIINFFIPGDIIKVYDSDLGFDGSSIVQTINRDLLNHYDYALQLSEEKPRSGIYSNYIASRKSSTIKYGNGSIQQISGLSPQQLVQVNHIFSSGTIAVAATLRTYKFYVGDGAIPDGFIHKDITPDNILEHADLIGKRLQGMQFIDKVPFDFEEDGIPYNQTMGMFDLSNYPLYDGMRIVVVASF